MAFPLLVVVPGTKSSSYLDVQPVTSPSGRHLCHTPQIRVGFFDHLPERRRDDVAQITQPTASDVLLRLEYLAAKLAAIILTIALIWIEDQVSVAVIVFAVIPVAWRFAAMNVRRGKGAIALLR